MQSVSADIEIEIRPLTPLVLNPLYALAPPPLGIGCLLQAREAGGDELDDLVSAPRMVLQQYVDKWFPEDPADLARMSEKALRKLLLDVSDCMG
jgi:hypothetical protein